MSAVSEEILADCLELLSEGLTAEQILARYPDQQEALRPFLGTAAQLTKLATQPTLAAKERSRQAMLHRAAEMRTVRRARPTIWAGLQRLLLPVGSFAAVLFLIGTTVLIMSASSVPGDGLYGAKRFVERARLAPLTDPGARTALLETFDQERIREVEALLRSGREAEVQFKGAIEEIMAEYWTVASIRVEITGETIIDGLPRSGAMAQIEGRTGSGKLTASHIMVAAGDLPVEEDPPEPEPEPETSPTAAVTPRATATPAATETPTPLAPAAEPPTTSPLPVNPPTDTPVPPAPEPPPVDDNANDNQTNENEGDEDESEDESNENKEEEDDENVNEDSSGSENDNDDDNENDRSGSRNGNDNDNENS